MSYTKQLQEYRSCTYYVYLVTPIATLFSCLSTVSGVLQPRIIWLQSNVTVDSNVLGCLKSKRSKNLKFSDGRGRLWMLKISTLSSNCSKIGRFLVPDVAFLDVNWGGIFRQFSDNLKFRVGNRPSSSSLPRRHCLLYTQLLCGLCDLQ